MESIPGSATLELFPSSEDDPTSALLDALTPLLAACVEALEETPPADVDACRRIDALARRVPVLAATDRALCMRALGALLDRKGDAVDSENWRMVYVETEKRRRARAIEFGETVLELARACGIGPAADEAST